MQILEWPAAAGLVTIGTAATSALIWVIRLEGRVNVHEAVCAERYRYLEERYAEGLEKMRSIETKIDALMQRE